MKTDSLNAALGADTVADPPPRAILWPALAGAMVVAVLAVWQVLGFREDLPASLADPLSAMRFVLTAALGVTGLRLDLVLAQPEGRALARLWLVATPVVVALRLLVWAYVAALAKGRQMALVGKTMVT